MNPPTEAGSEARWPGHVISWCATLRRAGGDDRAEARARLWNLLRDGLLMALRREAARFRSATREDLEDLASAKALDLLSRAERGDWDTAGRSHGEIVAYLRSTARHGLLQFARQRERVVPIEALASRSREDGERLPEWSSPMPSPERTAESHEFAAGLLDCLSHMQPRSRFVWFLRAIHDLGSRDIAAHPEVRASAANVDVMLMRARAHLKDCLATKGLEPGHLPPGTFTLVWDQMARGAPVRVAVAGVADR